MREDWHRINIEAVLSELNSDLQRGLTAAEAARRLEEHGPNRLVEEKIRSPWHILWEQFTSTMVVILIVAAVLSAALGDFKDAIAILVILVLNAMLGFSQEYRAEKAMAALKQLAVPHVHVRREGEVREIVADEVVPGDIVLLEAGNLVPCDCRLLESAGLRIMEAALTGESEAVEKSPTALDEAELPLGDRRNMAYMGTLITYGRGVGVTTATGMATQLGQIATMLQKVEREPTPLQRRLDTLGKRLALIALALVGIVFVIGLVRGSEVKEMFLTSVSLAVAAVPEGLPAVVTIALALGAQRMLKRKALIRKLPAVETLGSVTVICSDKTGTLTQNRMTVTTLDVAGNLLDMTELEAHPETPRENPAVELLLIGSALCNDATLSPPTKDEDSPPQALGDPTEGALVIAAYRAGLDKANLDKILPRVSEVPFDSDRKRMTTVHRLNVSDALPASLASLREENPSAEFVIFTKGALDRLLPLCTHLWTGERREPITEAWQERITDSSAGQAKEGMRVLGLAFRMTDNAAQNTELERDLTFIGMEGMRDPIREEAKEAVATCRAAGIRPVMITGDHQVTAEAIARQLGIAGEGGVLSGSELDVLSTEELQAKVESVSVYARVSPEHKLAIIAALQAKNHVVAMTGDGVNDAPALKKADIGVAMGLGGTDVAKEAADMTLQDDNFATIVAAVEEGRIIYDNIRKFIKYLLTTNSGEIWLMLLAPFLGMPVPLLPLQILWINLVTDGLPALALGVEPGERNVMRRPPRAATESLFDREMSGHILCIGLLMGLVSLGVGYFAWRAGNPDWQTLVFTTLTLTQMCHILAIRSERDSLFRIGLFSNPAMLGAVSLTFLLQVAVIYIPWLNGFFQTRPLTGAEFALCLALSTSVFWAVELEKWFLRRAARPKTVAAHA